jgi:Protein of unknown function (DUF5674)
MTIQLVRESISLDDLRDIAHGQFGEFVKAVVDIRQEVMAIGAELHADEEAFLIERGARHADLWGINLYPDRPLEERVDFDSMINVRPSQGNRSRSVEDIALQRRIQSIVARLLGA